MNPAQFQKLFEQKINQVKDYARNTLPRHIGKIAVDHFHENFQKGGFIDENLEPWKPTKRTGSTQYGTLLSSRKELYNSITDTPAENSVKISSDKPYSKIHNEGGEIAVTAKMKKFAWAQYYSRVNQVTYSVKSKSANYTPAAKDLTTEARMWRAIALKKVGSFITIPKRKYMGRSAQLNRKIQERIMKDVKQILLSQ